VFILVDNQNLQLEYVVRAGQVFLMAILQKDMVLLIGFNFTKIQMGIKQFHS
jgi:hypothetical protein